MRQETRKGDILLEVESIHTQDLKDEGATLSKDIIESGLSGWGTSVYILHDGYKTDVTGIMSIKAILPHTIELTVNWLPTLNESQWKLLGHMGKRDLLSVTIEPTHPDTHAVIGNGIIEEIEINYEAEKITQAVIVIQTPPDQDKALNFAVWRRITCGTCADGSDTNST